MFVFELVLGFYLKLQGIIISFLYVAETVVVLWLWSDICHKSVTAYVLCIDCGDIISPILIVK